MKLEIKTKAYKTLLNVLLSCQCPITAETEKDLIDFYNSNSSLEILDFSEVMKIVEKEKDETVFHRLKEFFLYSINDTSKGYLILKEDILRHFSTGFHWRLIEKGISGSYKKIINIPSWFVGHMLLPVKIVRKNDSYQALYKYNNHSISLEPLFLPHDIVANSTNFYCVHFASIIAEISSEQYEMISQQLEAIDLFDDFRKDLTKINYLDFQKFGNYFKICEERYKTYYA